MILFIGLLFDLFYLDYISSMWKGTDTSTHFQTFLIDSLMCSSQLNSHWSSLEQRV